MSYNPNNPNGATTGANSSPVVTATDDVNLKGLAASAAGGYVRQDSNATIAKESGGNLATIVTNTGNSATAVNQTNGTQQTKITNGTTIADVQAIGSGQNALTVGPGYKEQTGSVSAISSLIPAFDASAYKWGSITLSGTWSGTVQIQVCNDNTNFVAIGTYNATATNSSTTSITSNSSYSFPIQYRYVRVQVTAYTSGTIVGTLESSTITPSLGVLGVNASQSGTWTVGFNSATGSAVPVNAGYVGMRDGSGNLIGLASTSSNGFTAANGANSLSAGMYINNNSGVNATTTDMARTANAAANTTGTGLLGTGILGFDGTNWQYAGINASHAMKVDGSAVTQPVSLATNTPTLQSGSTTAVTQATAANLNATVVGTGTFAAQVAGGTASGSSLTASPVTEGGLAKTSNPTAVSDAQVVNALFDKLGKQVVVGSVRDLKVNQVTTITASTAETTVLTAVAATFLDVYGVIVTNTSATAITVAFKDSTAGTTQFNVAVPAGDTRGFMLPEGGGIKQGTVNNNWTATTQSVTSAIITMLAVKNI